MFSLRPVLKSLALLVFLVPLSSVVGQQENDDSSTLMTSEDSNNGSLLMTNYNALREEGQGFYIHESIIRFETPNSVIVSAGLLLWWCDFKFLSDDTNNIENYGYVGQGVGWKLGSTYEDLVEAGAQLATNGERVALSVSAVMVPTLGIFEGQIHATHDDWVWRYWDDGSSTLPILGWEGHDEGDTSPSSDTCAFSLSGTFTKITTEAAAELLGMDVAFMTPATCSMEYEVAWNASHVPDPIDTSVTALEEEVAQLQADINELMSRMAATEGSLAASGSGNGGGDPISIMKDAEETDVSGIHIGIHDSAASTTASTIGSSIAGIAAAVGVFALL